MDSLDDIQSHEDSKTEPVIQQPLSRRLSNSKENIPSLNIINEPPRPTVMTFNKSTPPPSTLIPISSIAKSAPANPLTTKEDVESIRTANSSSSSINDNVTELAQTQSPATPPQSGFFNNMMTSLSFSKEPGNISNTSGESTVASDETTKITGSPSIISYRRGKRGKGRRGTSVSSLETPILSPLNEDQKPYSSGTDKIVSPISLNSSTGEDTFSTANYVDEKFKSTNYRYSSDDRNAEFHRLFKSIPEDERLIDDFSCALSREILLQGRLYISEHNICFNSNLLGWVTNLVIPFYDILNFEKTATAGLFHNGIAINLKNGQGRHSFATFLSRESTYNMFQDVWTAANDESPLQDDKPRQTRSSNEVHLLSKGLDLDTDMVFEEYNSVLMSIDGDTPSSRRRYTNTSNDDSVEDEEEDDEDETGYSSSDIKSETKTSSQVVYKLKPDSKYKYDGPYAHGPTRSDFVPETNKETILATEILKCPPGVIHEIIFGSNNDLILNLLKSQDGSGFSEFTEFKTNEDGLKERFYTYEKGLNYGFGPKSTTCNVTETIEKLDFSDHINVINTTQTPNVPSGNAFQVKTRYVITWNTQNTSKLIVSFWIDWIGSSWMKGVIERSCRNGQEAATKVLIELIKEAVEENTLSCSEEVAGIVELVETPSTRPEESVVVPPPPTPKLTVFTLDQIPVFQTLVVLLLVLVAIIQLLMVSLIMDVSRNTSVLSFLQSDSRTESLLFKGEEVLLWSWIDERAGKLNGSRREKTRLLKEEIDALIAKWTMGELSSPDGKKLMKRFEDTLNHYTEAFEGDESEKVKKAEELRQAISALL